MARVVKLVQEGEWVDNPTKNVLAVILLSFTLAIMAAGVLYVTYRVGTSYSNIAESLGE